MPTSAIATYSNRGKIGLSRIRLKSGPTKGLIPSIGEYLLTNNTLIIVLMRLQ